MSVYKIITDGGTMYASVELTQAASTIYTYFGERPFYDDDDDRLEEDGDSDGLRWAPTPYQTAEARHDEDKMAALVADYCDMGSVISVEAL